MDLLLCRAAQFCREPPLGQARSGVIFVVPTPPAVRQIPLIARQKYYFLARLAPRFLPGSPSYGNSNRWQIVEEAFFDILDPG
jgi:hypothetical protein